MHFFAQTFPAMPLFEIGPFFLLLLGLPVLLFGEWLVRRSALLAQSNVPPAIIGGLVVSFLLFAMEHVRPGIIMLHGSTSEASWLWSILPQWDLRQPAPMDVERPLLILFFTCIGFNASWPLARRGGRPLVILLILAIAIALLQAVSGAGVAVLLGETPLLGVMASNVSLMGGFGTAAGFAPEFEKAGLPGAAAIGVAAAAAGVIAGGLFAGLVGGTLIRRKLHVASPGALLPRSGLPAQPCGGLTAEISLLGRSPRHVLLHLFVLAVCMKLGAFLSVWIQRSGVTFPVYMGAMIVAAVIRNAHDFARLKWLNSDYVDGIGSVALMWLLTVVMMDLQLTELARSAVPLIAIVATQIALTMVLAYSVVFRLMGRDYEAATISAGMVGFALGAMSNAMASMRVMVQRFGPAPRAFLIVPIVGAFLVDFANAVITTVALNVLK